MCQTFTVKHVKKQDSFSGKYKMFVWIIKSQGDGYVHAHNSSTVKEEWEEFSFFLCVLLTVQ